MISLMPKRAAVIVVDLQEDLLGPSGLYVRKGWREVSDEEVQALVNSCRQLIDAAHATGQPVIFVKTEFRRDYADAALGPEWGSYLAPETGGLVEGTPGSRLLDGLGVKEGDFIVQKKSQNIFHDTILDRLLTNLGVTQCILTGTDLLESITNGTRTGRALGYDFFPVNEAMLPPVDFSRRMNPEETLSLEEVLAQLHSGREEVPGEERSALIVIDMQKDFLGPERHGISKQSGTEREFRDSTDPIIIENNDKLARAMRAKGLPVVFVKATNRPDALDSAFTKYWVSVVQEPAEPGKDAGFLHIGSRGVDIVDGLSVEDNDLIVEKKTHSAFRFTPLHRILRNLDVGHFYITGGAAAGCVSETVRDASAFGYQLTIVEDALYPAESPHVQESLAKYGDVKTTESVLETLAV